MNRANRSETPSTSKCQPLTSQRWHNFGLESARNATTATAVNPVQLQMIMKHNRLKNKTVGTTNKLLVKEKKPKLGINCKDFIGINEVQPLPRCLVVRKFKDPGTSGRTIFSKYNGELLEDSEQSFDSTDSSASNLDTEEGDRHQDLGTPLSALSSVTSVDLLSPRSKAAQPAPHKGPVIPPLNLGEDTSENIIADISEDMGGDISEDISEEISDDISEDISEEDFCSTGSGESETFRPTLTNPEYYMYPNIGLIDRYRNNSGRYIIRGLTIGRGAYGEVEFPEAIDISNMNLDEIVQFNHREINVYPDNNKKPPIGQGLNRTAIVSLHNVFPKDKATGLLLRDKRMLETDFVDELKRISIKKGVEFMEYRWRLGTWIFSVPHFSIYGFDESCQKL